MMAAADGEVAKDEVTVIKGIFQTIPELKDGDFKDTLARARRRNAEAGGYEKAIERLADYASSGIQNKIYLLAAEVAWGHGGTNPHERDMLEKMARALKVERTFVEDVHSVFAAKYTPASARLMGMTGA